MTSRLPATSLALLLALPACGDLTDVPAPVINVAYRPDGQVVVATIGGFKVYEGDLASETASMRIDGDYSTMAEVSADGQVAAFIQLETNQTSFYRVPDGLLLGSLAPAVPFIALSPAGDKAYVPGPHQGDDLPGGTTMHSLYDVASGKSLWSVDYLQHFAPNVYCRFGTDMPPPPAFTPDGTTMYLAFGEHLMTAVVATGAMREIANARACIGGLTLLPDGSLLVLRGFVGRAFTSYPGLNGAPLTDTTLPDAPLPNSFAIFNSDGTLLRELPPFPGFNTEATTLGIGSQVACSPTGDRCAMMAQKAEFYTRPDGFDVYGGPSYVLVWSLDGTLLYTIDPPARGKLAFSPDGSRLAVGYGYSDVPSSARIYRAADGALLAQRSYTKGVF